MDQNTYDILKSKADQYGIPINVWYPIVNFESGGNPAAIGDNGTSFGLFQVHSPVHPDYNTSNTDAAYQADYYLPVLKQSYLDGLSQGLSGLDLTLYVEKNGERPQWSQDVVNGITQGYNQITGGTAPMTGTNTGIFNPGQSNGVNALNFFQRLWSTITDRNLYNVILRNWLFVIFFIIILVVIGYSGKEVIK